MGKQNVSEKLGRKQAQKTTSATMIDGEPRATRITADTQYCLKQNVALYPGRPLPENAAIRDACHY